MPSASGSGSDWDQGAPSTEAHARRGQPGPKTKRKTAPLPVSDDWEDDDDDDGDGDDREVVNEDEDRDEDWARGAGDNPNQRIWRDANAQAPMPALILSASSTSSTHHTPAPPAAALQPAMRILKRPSPTGPVVPAAAPVAGETLKEREARYQAARDRIFGEADATGAAKKDKAGGVVRNPKGPDTDTDGTTPPRGFGTRNPPAPPRRTPSHDSKP
ncbi:hypothetical protein K438DRAFT_1964954 [Mycena galopus ATCC 62051]|nr:hypothetical protein K438DRAFT_1964954 [Mycena galopus ATCC 62051]